MTTFREWVHYRYGTYSEMGFESDPLYPSYYQSGPLEKASVGCRNLTLDSNLDTEQMVDASILRNKVRNWYLEIETTLTTDCHHDARAYQTFSQLCGYELFNFYSGCSHPRNLTFINMSLSATLLMFFSWYFLYDFDNFNQNCQN